ncbi:hypothetical protein HPB52_023194 [Rhipicephalus sanguineus]|uniref:Uncharacterized protein n=1 Tax=Rhipicephalus sanguineus TaxID=34632 RepID=A0A9D4QBG7_RHISA|nr:hypothetical protein HPB52_023194 [Rhipicephalus sanguineus]
MPGTRRRTPGAPQDLAQPGSTTAHWTSSASSGTSTCGLPGSCAPTPPAGVFHLRLCFGRDLDTDFFFVSHPGAVPATYPGERYPQDLPPRSGRSALHPTLLPHVVRWGVLDLTRPVASPPPGARAR